jgi:hypothetical protein
MSKEILNPNNWLSVNDKMPIKNKIVLISVPYCRHKIETGFFNGLFWLTIEGVKMQNVIHWADFNEENKIEFCEDSYVKSLKSLNYNFAKEKRTVAIDFLIWINKQVDFKYLPSENVYINVTTNEKYSEYKMFDVFLNIYGNQINVA